MNENKFTLKRTALIVSLKCNLKCRLCGAYSPYYTGKNPEINQLMEYVNKYFNIVDSVEIFSISGGEPLLYPQLPELLEYLMAFSDRFEKLEIITNATIIPSKELLKVIKKYGNKFFRFLIDDYDIGEKSKIPKIISTLNDFEIPFEIRNYRADNPHCGGWVDFGALTEKIHTVNEATQLFLQCAFPQKTKFCFNIIDGCLIPCSAVYRRKSLGFEVDSNDYINLMDTKLSVEEQRRKILNMYSTQYLESCLYCNGMCENSQRFAPAEQLTSEEIRKIKEQ